VKLIIADNYLSFFKNINLLFSGQQALVESLTAQILVIGNEK
jgi:hypothetical protein